MSRSLQLALQTRKETTTIFTGTATEKKTQLVFLLVQGYKEKENRVSNSARERTAGCRWDAGDQILLVQVEKEQSTILNASL